MNKKILIALTSHDKKGDTGQATGAYLPEVLHPYNVFSKAGYEVEFVSVQAGKAPLDGVNTDDAEHRAFLDNPEIKRALSQTPSASSPKAKDYAAIFYAGGHGTMWDFPNDVALANLGRDIYENGGVMGAVCHGPAALVNLKLSNGNYLVAGKRVSAFTNDEEHAVGLQKVVPFLLADELSKRGATHIPAANWAEQVIVDERLITGQNPASANGVAEAMVDALKSNHKQASV
jgi:putative intracellular protease/amidase